MTNQPVWKCVGHIGDIDPIAYGGGFVYIDITGVYAPELVYFEPGSDEEWKDSRGETKLQQYRLVLDPPRFKTLTEKGKKSGFGTRELPASERNDTWYWYSEWFMKDLASVADSCGTSTLRLMRLLLSKDAMERAWAYQDLIGYYGVHEFDSYPATLTEDEAYERYAPEMKLARA